MHKILIIDDEEEILSTYKRLLELNSYDVDPLSNPTEAATFLRNDYSCIILDVKMPGKSGIDILKEIKELNLKTPVIMLSDKSNVPVAVEALKEGAHDFVDKIESSDRFLLAVKNAVQHYELKFENETLLEEIFSNYKMIVQSRLMQDIISQINIIADTKAKVLITGETGTGKELIARAIHLNSRRRSKKMVTINCASIPSELLESELFGYVRGSFTGAIQDKTGKFQHADKSTIFLDEIGDMPMLLQSKLLRVLQEEEIEVIGDPAPRKVDVRIIAATNKNLEEQVEKGRFRDDLLYRLKVVHIHIPALRERREDIIPLARHFLEKTNQEYNKQVSLSSEAETFLKGQEWRGNVRELQNVIERLVVTNSSRVIAINQIIDAVGIGGGEGTRIAAHAPEPVTLKEAAADFEKSFIYSALVQHGWKIGETAHALSIDRSHLFKKMKQYNISKP